MDGKMSMKISVYVAHVSVRVSDYVCSYARCWFVCIRSMIECKQKLNINRARVYRVTATATATVAMDGGNGDDGDGGGSGSSNIEQSEG